jgi:UDP-N-acetylglucosamine--N-acetylmuramyl-(pentapeptide) pyrophosphoryl-undecaprenol N-acetylglucosamine transferase
MKIIFAAGGTGGHINPALATADEIKRKYPDASVLFIGTQDHMESRLVPQAGYELKTIKVEGFKRGKTFKSALKNVEIGMEAVKAQSDAAKIIKEFKPDVVAGFGGYVSGPVVKAAQQLKITTAIHEQNAYPGVTNKLLASKADVVMLAFPDTEKYLKCKNKPVFTGLPVRRAILEADGEKAKKELSPDNRKIVLSFGGSLGAEKLNETMTDVISSLYSRPDVRFIHARGGKNESMESQLEKRGIDLKNGTVDIRQYIFDMDKCLSAADIVVCRSGASTVSEIEADGKAAILIPSPNVAENHQFKNAMALAEKNAAAVIEEKDLTAQKLSDEIIYLLENDGARMTMAENAKNLSRPDALEKIAGIIEDLAMKK